LRKLSISFKRSFCTSRNLDYRYKPHFVYVPNASQAAPWADQAVELSDEEDMNSDESSEMSGDQDNKVDAWDDFINTNADISKRLAGGC
jgi:hypothetical protein